MTIILRMRSRGLVTVPPASLASSAASSDLHRARCGRAGSTMGVLGDRAARGRRGNGLGPHSRRWSLGALILVAGAVLVVAPASRALAAPPANDLIENATPITVLPFTATQDNTDATV